MEPEGNIVETPQPSPLYTVTPLSKYLAMTLFIILPFLGGWVGYTYAPEKVVEVERVVEKSSEPEIEYNPLTSTLNRDIDNFEFINYPDADVKFFIRDLNNTIAYSGGRSYLIPFEVGLEDNQMYWWGGTATVTNPTSLRYLGSGLMSDGVQTYPLLDEHSSLTGLFENQKVIIPEDIEFDPNEDIEVFDGYAIQGDRFFVAINAPLSSSPVLGEITNFNVDELKVFGHAHYADDKAVYYTDTGLGGPYEVTKLEGADPNKFTFYSHDESEHPLFGVSGENVYYGGELLEGIKFSEIEFLMGNAVVKDSDTVWFRDVGCHNAGYREGTLDEIANYVPPC